MATQRENAIIDVVINGEQAISSFRELNRLRNDQIRLVQTLNRNDPNYAAQVQRLEQLNAAQRAWRNEIMSTGEAQEGLFSGFKKGWDSIKNIAASVSIGNLISKGIEGAMSAVSNLINTSEAAYQEAQKTQTALQQTLKTTQGVSGQTVDSLGDMQSALMDQTGVDDDVIAKGEQMLLTFTNIRGKIYEQALPAIMDMTAAMNQGNVTMEGIQTTSIQVGKALNDPIKGVTALAKVGVTFNAQQKEQIKTLVESNRMMDAQAIILKELQKEFGGTAAAIANTDVGAMQKFETRLGNIQENIGKWIVSGKSLAAQVLDPFLSWLEKATSTPLADTLRQEQAEMNGLVNAIIITNDNQTVRNQLIAELESKYPDFLGHIDAERISNEMLVDRLKQVNDQYRTKIFIAANEDKIKDIQERRTKAVREEADARERVAKASGLSASQLAKLTDEQIRAMAQQQLEEKRKVSNLSAGMGTGGATSGSYWENKAMNDVDLIVNGRQRIAASFREEGDLMNANAIYQDKLTKQQLADIDKQIAALRKKIAVEKGDAKAQDQGEVDKLLQKRKSLLGIVDKPESGPSAQSVKSAQDEADRIKKIVADMHKEFKELNNQDLINQENKNKQEILLEEQKWNAKIAKAKEILNRDNDPNNKVKLTSQQKGELNTDIESAQKGKEAATKRIQERQTKDAETAAQASADKELEIYTNLGQKLQGLREEMTAQYGSELDKQKARLNKTYQEMFGDLEGNLEAQQLILDQWDAAIGNAERKAKEDLENDKQEIEDRYQSLTGNKHDLQLAAIKARYDKERQALKDKYAGQLADSKAFKEAMDLLNASEKAETDKQKKENQKALLQAAVQTAQEVSSTLFSIGASNREAELSDQISSLERQRKAELNNANLTESQKSAINKKYDEQEKKEKLKKWKADQKAAQLQAAINTALAVTMALATTPWPLSLFTAGAALAAGIAQQVAISKQKPPEFATGGYLPDGPSHAAGGMNVVDPMGNVVANIEGGEPIISKKTAAANPDLISALLSSGGQTVNYERILQARKATNNGTTTPISAPAAGSSTLPSVREQASNSTDTSEIWTYLKELTVQVQAADRKQVVLSNRVLQDNNDKNVMISNAVDA